MTIIFRDTFPLLLCSIEHRGDFILRQKSVDDDNNNNEILIRG